MSQNFDLGLGLFVMLCRIYENNFFTIIYVLYHKIVTKSIIKNLRHASLEKNVLNDFLKFYISVQNSK